ncbi:DUF1097 domain-containing protein [Tamlana sp. 62-3]|uniref:DUF1097 domain-containing protein n=1 Tax=Neotamlana sargassicola TaxID=2883125 RepID=A0A9X1L5Z7_9FLAO|nr:DUF1097 domain-containing protein [Tamlana sargassicola]MCB4807186.1 DUF1097 domain-containing protein [Tamlana sargassicola]
MKQFLSAIIMGVCGALATYLAFSFNLPSWVLFLAWVSYYLFGKSFKSALLTLVPISAGIIMGTLILSFGGLLGSYLGKMGFPMAVFIFISTLTYLSKIKYLNNIPAWFMGLIIFFGVHPHVQVISILSLFLPILLGLAFAFINDTLTQLVFKTSVKS